MVLWVQTLKRKFLRRGIVATRSLNSTFPITIDRWAKHFYFKNCINCNRIEISPAKLLNPRWISSFINKLCQFKYILLYLKDVIFCFLRFMLCDSNSRSGLQRPGDHSKGGKLFPASGCLDFCSPDLVTLAIVCLFITSPACISRTNRFLYTVSPLSSEGLVCVKQPWGIKLQRPSRSFTCFGVDK